jgi:hypothetical protein
VFISTDDTPENINMKIKEALEKFNIKPLWIGDWNYEKDTITWLSNTGEGFYQTP